MKNERVVRFVAASSLAADQDPTVAHPADGGFFDCRLCGNFLVEIDGNPKTYMTRAGRALLSRQVGWPVHPSSDVGLGYLRVALIFPRHSFRGGGRTSAALQDEMRKLVGVETTRRKQKKKSSSFSELKNGPERERERALEGNSNDGGRTEV